MKKIFSFVLLSIHLILQAEEHSAKEKFLLQIDQAVASLESEKIKLEKKVAYHRSRGSLWQFNKENSLESKREYFLAEQERDKIQLLELKIQNFRHKKEEVLAEDCF